MRYFKVNAALEVVEMSDKYPGECKGQDGGMWARQPGGVWGAGWLNRWDISEHPAPMMFAQQIANSASKLHPGVVFIAADSGECVSPRYEVIEAPAIGVECSKAFNGDYYPVGKIIAIAKNYSRITVDGPRGKLVFYRQKLSGRWVLARMWALVPGVINRWNPEF